MTGRALEIPVRFKPASGITPARKGEPVTFGVPLPRGVCSPTDSWRLRGPGFDDPVQTQALDLWGDGSVRWLLADAFVSTSDPDSAFTLYRDDGKGRPNDSKNLPVTFEQGQPFPMSGTSLRLSDERGNNYEVRITSAKVQATGPVRTTVAVTGNVTGQGPLTELLIQASVDLFAGTGVSKLAITIRNPKAAVHAGGFWDLGDPGSLYIREASLHVETNFGGRPSIRYSAETGQTPQEAAGSFELYQDSSGGENWKSPNHINRERRIPVTFRGYRVRDGQGERTGLRATPVVSVADGSSETSVSIEHFWQNFPKAISVAPDGAITLSLFPSQFADVHELQGGEQKTHVCYVSRNADRITDVPLDWTRDPLIAVIDPDWIMGTGAIPWLAPDEPDHRALILSAIDGTDTFARKREVVDQYGWRNFGDVYGDHEGIRHNGPSPLVSHYNNQYDVVAGFLFQFVRSGDVRWWSMARELARHVVDIDIYHTQRDKASLNHGLFWHTYHYGDADTANHRTYPKAGQGETHGGGPSPDQNYTSGLLLYHLLTGDQSARDTVVDSAQYVIDADDGAKTVFRWLSRERTGLISASGSYTYHGPGRGPANSLNALVDGHRVTGDARFLAKAEELICRVVHPTEDVGKHQLDDPENKWFYLMFLQSLGKYLGYKVERNQNDEMYAYARACLVHYARWMADNEYPYLEKPERLTFPTETWAAHEIRKSDVFYLAAMHATGADRERFLERGRFFFRNSVETLAARPTRTLARPVIVLLSSGLMHPWFQGHRDASLPQPQGHAFPPHQRFVPQREIAMRRAKLLIGAAGALGMMAAAAAAYFFFMSAS